MRLKRHAQILHQMQSHQMWNCVFMEVAMRTTLDIDDDILSASKELAKAAGKTAGQIISELARKALTQPLQHADHQVEQPKAFHGIRPFPKRHGG